jgi:hypothetical protein
MHCHYEGRWSLSYPEPAVAEAAIQVMGSRIWSSDPAIDALVRAFMSGGFNHSGDAD